MSGYRERAAKEMRGAAPPATVVPIMRKLIDDSAVMLARGPEDARARATAARAYAIDHLDALHEQLRASFERRRISYHRAATAEDAVATVKRLLGDAKRVAKSKSMVAEEIGLTHALRGGGIDVLETDIGEYIVDIEGRGPSHITAPALHLNRSRIRDLLARSGASLPDDDPELLSRHVRDVVGEYFKNCDAAITGANALIASSGRIVIVENEGNVSLGVSHPKLHIVVTGIEKVLADEAAALAVLEVLAPSATAQPLTSFTHFLADPAPGQERHVVLVDNGRSRIAGDARYREILRCIRCGACMNGCPVYRIAGGLSYGSAYMGPMGAVLSPLLWPGGRFSDLPFASTLCGRCTEVCPAGIPLHRMLLDLRADAVSRHEAAGRTERAAWTSWALAFSAAPVARAAAAFTRVSLRSAGRLLRPRGSAEDPRVLPEPPASRDPAMLEGTGPGGQGAGAPVVEIAPEDMVELFRLRAGQLGVEVVDQLRKKKGDLRLRAAAAIASTGSVVLTGDGTARRPLLAAARVVVEVDPASVVRFPSDLASLLGDGEALILTGASRTADIEKQIVRGIHGAEEMVVVLKAG